jgi:hypothetical protein
MLMMLPSAVTSTVDHPLKLSSELPLTLPHLPAPQEAARVCEASGGGGGLSLGSDPPLTPSGRYMLMAVEGAVVERASGYVPYSKILKTQIFNYKENVPLGQRS